MKPTVKTISNPVIRSPETSLLILEAGHIPLHQLASNLRLDLCPLEVSAIPDPERNEPQRKPGPIGKKETNRNALPALIDAAEAAQICGMARTTWFKMRNAGKVPDPIRFGRVVRWSIHELERWIEAGSPPAHRWRAIKEQQSRREKR